MLAYDHQAVGTDSGLMVIPGGEQPAAKGRTVQKLGLRTWTLRAGRGAARASDKEDELPEGLARSLRSLQTGVSGERWRVDGWLGTGNQEQDARVWSQR
jgi:hypothetical protein